MSRETDRLIADRGHGLSRTQREAIRWLATDRREGAPPRFSTTWRSLEARGLLTLRPLKLTDDGYTLALRMGITASPPGRELTNEDRALCAEEARMKRLEDV